MSTTRVAYLLFFLLLPNYAFARGTLFDVRDLFYIAMGICAVAGVYYIIFIAPSLLINKANSKRSPDDFGMKVWITFLYTLFVPVVVIGIFGLKSTFAIVLVLVAWLISILYFFKKGGSKSSLHNDSKTDEKLKVEINEVFYEWELTDMGLVNLKTGHLVPKSHLRQIDEPEPGCLIDNYILHTEFIPEKKIKFAPQTPLFPHT